MASVQRVNGALEAFSISKKAESSGSYSSSVGHCPTLSMDSEGGIQALRWQLKVNRGRRQGKSHLLQQTENKTQNKGGNYVTVWPFHKNMSRQIAVIRRGNIDLEYKEFLYKCTTWIEQVGKSIKEKKSYWMNINESIINYIFTREQNNPTLRTKSRI